MDEFACHQRSLELACTDMFRQKGTLNEEHALAMSLCIFCLSIRETGGVPSRACCSNDLEPGAAFSTRIQSWQLNAKQLCAVLEKGQNIRNVPLLPTHLSWETPAGVGRFSIRTVGAAWPKPWRVATSATPPGAISPPRPEFRVARSLPPHCRCKPKELFWV